MHTRSTQRQGRDRELELIAGQLALAQHGRCRIVLLAGEPGIGKTRLLEAVATHAAEGGTLVRRGGASEAEGMPPDLPLLEALGQHIRVASTEALQA